MYGLIENLQRLVEDSLGQIACYRSSLGTQSQVARAETILQDPDVLVVVAAGQGEFFGYGKVK